MPDRIYVTYKPTVAPESYHVATHYERTDHSGNVTLHRVIDAGPQNNETLSPFEKAIGTLEEMFRDDRWERDSVGTSANGQLCTV